MNNNKITFLNFFFPYKKIITWLILSLFIVFKSNNSAEIDCPILRKIKYCHVPFIEQLSDELDIQITFSILRIKLIKYEQFLYLPNFLQINSLKHLKDGNDSVR